MFDDGRSRLIATCECKRKPPVFVNNNKYVRISTFHRAFKINWKSLPSVCSFYQRRHYSFVWQRKAWVPHRCGNSDKFADIWSWKWEISGALEMEQSGDTRMAKLFVHASKIGQCALSRIESSWWSRRGARQCIWHNVITTRTMNDIVLKIAQFGTPHLKFGVLYFTPTRLARSEA